MELFEIGFIAFVGITAFFSYSAGRSKGTIHAMCFLKEFNCLKPFDSLKGTEDWPESLKKMYDNPREYL